MTQEEQLRKAEAGLVDAIKKYEMEAERFLIRALEMQHSFAERLLLASGAALGVLSTLIATDVSWLSAEQFTAPVLLFILSILLAGLGLWLRSIAFLKQSTFSIQQAAALDWMKSEAERQMREGILGQVPPPDKPKTIEAPDKLYSALDVLIVLSATSFAGGLIWTGLAIILAGSA
ncbi:MAG: hypothetical protein R3C00_13685 [Hyphomonas sp.]|nr:hypothetical protein [Hyphomonas sp.]